ncbi:MAG: hypothetical protein AB7O57_10115 [Hyphomicrobiaceae bacterium]
MLKIALVVWIILGTTLAGTALAVIVSVPHLLDQGMRLIPIACGAAFVAALPLAYLIALQIGGSARQR